MLSKEFVIICCMVILFLITEVGLIATILIINEKNKRRIEEITMYQINTSARIDESIPQILDFIIMESFTDYKIKELVVRENEYINSQREEEIRRDLVDIVTSRISRAALDKISLFYNRDNIGEVLADKIYIAVMNYVIDHNKDIQS